MFRFIIQIEFFLGLFLRPSEGKQLEDDEWDKDEQNFQPTVNHESESEQKISDTDETNVGASTTLYFIQVNINGKCLCMFYKNWSFMLVKMGKGNGGNSLQSQKPLGQELKILEYGYQDRKQSYWRNL
ncbi:hypothetical protein GWI33_018732 [Rhynchophorus ferrugineus]|uniref:Uncharacterized protein n=1 Tax=Rhynchophorus ferrugineus TaxID=354439 RepID=A0A834HUC3_RHYFE|nr:hypothetical protein GWI33_018732 [Rhynchophorus ferrugineus]